MTGGLVYAFLNLCLIIYHFSLSSSVHIENSFGLSTSAVIIVALTAEFIKTPLTSFFPMGASWFLSLNSGKITLFSVSQVLIPEYDFSESVSLAA